MTYANLFPNAVNTPQRQRTPGRTDEVKNRNDGYVFKTNKWTQLTRFLVLGSEAPTYYVSAKHLTAHNAQNIIALIREDGLRVVNEIVNVSVSGRAPKNSPALFALALCAKYGDVETKTFTYNVMPKVARTTTHLIEWTEYCKNVLGISGAGFRKAGARWYTGMDTSRLAYQVVKYRQRNGWTHKNLLQVFHPMPENPIQQDIFHWITKGTFDGEDVSTALEIIGAYEQAKTASESELVTLIRERNLPREAVPTQHLNSVAVWEALLQKMPLHALVRNVNKMTAIGLLAPLSNATQLVKTKLSDGAYIKKSRLHPLSILVAMRTYANGVGKHFNWTPVTTVIDALDDAFYLAFDAVEPANKRTMFAVDVSSSMTWNTIAGMPITPRMGAAVLAMVGLRTEPSSFAMAFSHTLVNLPISARQRLDDVMHLINRTPMGGTDCSLPMIYATQSKLNVDTFVILTDNQTHNGSMHPYQALEQYKNQSGIDARLVTVGMESDGFTIADPTRNDMLDVVGFDTATPSIITAFSKGEV